MYTGVTQLGVNDIFSAITVIVYSRAIPSLRMKNKDPSWAQTMILDKHN